MQLFALSAGRPFGERLAAALGIPLSPLEEREFEDGEHKSRPLADVQGSDTYIVQGLHGEASQGPAERLMRLLFFAATLKEHRAARVTAVAPYLAFSRKDRQTRPGDPVTTRYVARLMEASGIDRILTLETHNLAAFQNAFRIPTLHLDAGPLFVDRLRELAGSGPLVAASPDPGGVKRAQLFREELERTFERSVGLAYLEKRRTGGVVSGTLLAGDVAGATVVILDDLIATGHTLARAARTCLAHGAARVIACAAHGLFVAGADEALADPAFARVLISDTVPHRLGAGARERLEVVSAAPLFAAAIRRLSRGLAPGDVTAG